MSKILLTGGCGYIGSHIGVELIESGKEVVVLDNLSNSSKLVLDRIEEITGKKPIFYEGDIRDTSLLIDILKNEDIESVIHLAGLKSVSESVKDPITYYDNNVNGSLSLVKAMDEVGVKNLIFSSSATVYGDPESMPIDESTPKGVCTNPYGWSKSMVEEILMDLSKADDSYKVVILRYFNPVGAHKSGLIGEVPTGIPNNLSPYVARVASGDLDHVRVYGDDYETPDGTGVRDYIHVIDLARGHVRALDKLDSLSNLEIINLGTGRGYSVFDMIDAFSKVTGIDIGYEIEDRRSGDVATSYCDPQKAKNILGWQAQYDLIDMARDSWNFQKLNPNGYEKEK